MQPLRFVVIGIGGYSLVHMRAIDWLNAQGLGKLEGVVALEEEQKRKPDLIQSLVDKGVTLYNSIDHFFQNGVATTDILTVPIGIHMHAPVSIQAMKMGLDVFCEKPISATIQEVDQLIKVKNETRRKLTIGFQHIYSNSIKLLKHRICNGNLGQVKSASILCGWPRSKQYYLRNNWAGKLKLDNYWILDSPANNAHAHYLLNMFYLSSQNIQKTDNPIEIRADLYRANHIESPDLVQLKIDTDSGTKCHIILAHSNWQELGPIMKLHCEKGDVTWETDDGETTITYKNGKIEKFNNLIHDKWRFDCMKDLVLSIQNNSEPLCTPELARPHTLTVNIMHQSCPEIFQIPNNFITEIEDYEMFPPEVKGNFRKVNKLDEIMKEAFEKNVFINEMNIPWARRDKLKSFKIDTYNRYPQFN